MTELNRVHTFYMFSLASFINVVNRALDKVQVELRAQKGVAKPAEGEEGEAPEYRDP